MFFFGKKSQIWVGWGDCRKANRGGTFDGWSNGDGGVLEFGGMMWRKWQRSQGSET